MHTRKSNKYPLFAYGTLMFNEVFKHVTKAIVEGESALLEDYQRYYVKNAEYPGIIPEQGSSIKGVLFRDLSDQVWERLDIFEGDEYERVLLDVKTACDYNIKIEPAWVYLYNRSMKSRLSNKIWNVKDISEISLGQLLGR
jgi:gamma-glutamylcyclotransferase (GGCT)/AIG2-like uncharacterized protein YtfP